jgi:rhodanese-related sulfurtransferase
MSKVLWIVLVLVAAGALGEWGAVSVSARNCSVYNGKPALEATMAAATAMPEATAVMPEATATATLKPAEYHKLTAEEAKARMDSGDPVTIVDVRTLSEFKSGHVPGAINVPNEDILDEMPDQLPDLDAELLVYCRSGRRSSDASHKLVAMGYTKVYDFGGILDWPYDTEK